MDDVLIETGTWNQGNECVSWDLFQSATLLKTENCTAVFCVAITDDQKILLVKERRGWGMPGGHIESGETLVNALQRECTEEAGFRPHNPKLFGYRKITATTPTQHPEPGRQYPFPVSYIAYYVARCVGRPQAHTEADVSDVCAFLPEELKGLRTPDHSTIMLGWNYWTK